MKSNVRKATAVLLLAFATSAGFIAAGQGQTGAAANTSAPRFKPDAVSSAGYRSPGDLHKVSVSDAQLAQTLRAQGARVIADYGGYVLFEVKGAALGALKDSRAFQVVDENNLVLLNAGSIDTRMEKPARGATVAKGGKQMRLIHFAGPIRPEWYKALVDTGVRVVTYIPNNAYLVYGSADALKAVQTLAANNAITQWDGDYTAAFRLDSRIAATNATRSKGAIAGQLNVSAQGNEQFTIQMVEDADENKLTLALIDQLKLEPIIKQDSMLGYVNVRVTLPKDAVVRQIAERPDVVSIQPWITPRKRDERQNIIISGNVTGAQSIPTPMETTWPI